MRRSVLAAVGAIALASSLFVAAFSPAGATPNPTHTVTGAAANTLSDSVNLGFFTVVGTGPATVPPVVTIVVDGHVLVVTCVDLRDVVASNGTLVAHTLDIAGIEIPSLIPIYTFIYDDNNAGGPDAFMASTTPGAGVCQGDSALWSSGGLPLVTTGNIVITP